MGGPSLWKNHNFTGSRDSLPCLSSHHTHIQSLHYLPLSISWLPSLSYLSCLALVIVEFVTWSLDSFSYGLPHLNSHFSFHMSSRLQFSSACRVFIPRCPSTLVSSSFLLCIFASLHLSFCSLSFLFIFFFQTRCNKPLWQMQNFYLRIDLVGRYGINLV